MHKDLKDLLDNTIFCDMLNSLSECIYIVDEKGIICFINRAAEKFERITNESIKGKHINEIYVQNESPTLQTLKKKTAIPEHENTYMIDGKEFRQIAKSVPLFGHDGRLIGAYTVQHDITFMNQILTDNIQYQKKLATEKTAKKKQFSSLIGQSDDFLECIHIAKNASDSDSSVLLSGFTGSGKEVFAESIHNAGSRKNKPFLAVNCAALPEGLLESLLFGTTKGSFTGSIDKKGLFEQAQGGTLFLDEINSMPLSSQAKLLRVLEEKKIRRIGGDIDINTDIRIISSINTTPAEALRNKQLREDLFFRLSVITIIIPPLVTRKNDILLLADHFIKKFSSKLNKNIKSLDDDCIRFFMSYGWPGNVRQLKHVIESAINIADKDDDKITFRNLPKYLFDKHSIPVDKVSPGFNPAEYADLPNQISIQALSGCETPNYSQEKNPANMDNVFSTIRENEKKKIIDALLLNNGNVSRTARYLNMNRQTLVYRMKKYNIKR